MLRITEVQKNIAIVTYAEAGTVLKAAQVCGLSRQTLYREMKRDKKFKEAMESAKQEYIESLENVLDHRIRNDNDKASALLLMFKLKKENPDYRDKIDHKVDGNVTFISRNIPRPPRKEEGAKNLLKP